MPPLRHCWVWLSPLLVACAPVDGLGRINVQPSCAALDRACLEEGFDAPIAVGSSVDVQLDLWLPGSAPPPVTLEIVGSLGTVLGTRVTVMKEGTTALLFNGPDGDVYDFIHLWAQGADGLAVRRRTAAGTLGGELTGSVQLTAGEQLPIRVAAQRDGADLLGEFPVESAYDGDVATVLADGVAGEYTIAAVGAGSTTILLSGLGVAVEMVVNVTGEASE